MNSAGSQPHILVINHSPDILLLMRELLEAESFQVTTQSHLDRDLEAISQLSPAAIIMDYMWAESDDEWVLLNMISMDPRTREIPIVLCTGAVRQVTEMREHLASMGITVVLKPFDINHLIDVMNEVVGTSPGSERRLTSMLE